MLVCKHTELIKAPQTVIWKRLTDQGTFSKLDSRLQKIEYPVRVGSAVTVAEKANDGSEHTNMAKITKFEANSFIRWSGRIFPFGLLNFSETISLTEVKKNETEYTHSRELSGLLASFMKMGDQEREQAHEKLSLSMRGLKDLLESK
jgi:hypothetical protein